MKTAYPITSNPVTITLYANIPFDNTYKNHTIISDLFRYNTTSLYTGTTANTGVPKERFLNRKQALAPQGNYFYYPRWTFLDTFNFHYSNGLICSVVMELTPAQTNANYMKVVSGTDTYYYFITAINQLNEDTYTLSLECDVLMTYQDEFLISMQGTGSSNITPVFTTRKHCHRYTADGIMPYCADLKTGDDAFASIKPSYISKYIATGFDDSSMKKLEDILWLYVCCDVPESVMYSTIGDPLFKFKEKPFPLGMVAIPLNVNSITYKKNDGTCSVTHSRSDLNKCIKTLIGNGEVHGCKISPYPPFVITSDSYVVTKDSSGNVTISSSAVTTLYSGDSHYAYEMGVNNNTLLYGSNSVEMTNTIYKLSINYGGVVILHQKDNMYYMSNILSSQFGFNNTYAPTILSNRYDDPKLLFSPFKKYVLTSQYSSEGWEFYPELTFSKYKTAVDSVLFKPYSIATAYIGDNNFYTTFDGYHNNTYKDYNYAKNGLMGSVNYIFPCGENALDVFNSTQSQSFYTSKVASGITSGITMAGGIGMLVGGAVMTASGYGTPAGIGMIGAGATALASGTASLITNIKSVNAKMEDLKNTPDSINSIGSNYLFDESVCIGSTLSLPFILIYDVAPSIKQNANDYFYNYGYQVARDCHFNLELKVDMSGNNFIDNNLFGRTIFNFVQINEDITNKINADIPLIAKQKLSSIFNNGITLWSFFGFSPLWSDDDTQPTGIPMPDRWFLKNTYDNTEYNG